MKQPMVVTNLRMPTPDYLQVKMMAGELGMSVNEYIYSTLVGASTKRMMHDTKKSKQTKMQSFYDAMLALANKPLKANQKPMGLSEDDEIIYGV
jgi:hypothetical protein